MTYTLVTREIPGIMNGAEEHEESRLISAFKMGKRVTAGESVRVHQMPKEKIKKQDLKLGNNWGGGGRRGRGKGTCTRNED